MFSVIIPVHNKFPHIERSVNSVLQQTFQDFEILLIDDASTDGSSKVIDGFTDKRIRKFSRLTPGPGGYYARNLGVKEAKGEWVAFLDADDMWYPDHLEKCLKVIEENPNVYMLSCGWEVYLDRKVPNKYYNNHVSRGSHIIDIFEYFESCRKKERPVWTSVCCIRKSSPMANNLFPAEFGAKRGGDLYAWLKMICYHKEMAWSNHIGAVYYMESVNMVTKNAEASFSLLTKDHFSSLSKGLKDIEKQFLKRYFNNSIFKVGLALRRQDKTVSVFKLLHWKGDFLNALGIQLILSFPLPVISHLARLKGKLK